jgi:hypothetical protein
VTESRTILIECQECGLPEKISLNEEEIGDVEALCIHEQNPANCPNLRQQLSAAGPSKAMMFSAMEARGSLF